MINIQSTSKNLVDAVYSVMTEKKSVKEVEEPRAKGEKDFKDLHSYVIKEKLDPKADAGVWIDDFVKSDAPQFKGKSKEERIQMALGAYYGARKDAGLEEDAIRIPEGVADFIGAASKAAANGKKEFEFGGKTYPVKISKKVADKVSKSMGESTELEEGKSLEFTNYKEWEMQAKKMGLTVSKTVVDSDGKVSKDGKIARDKSGNFRGTWALKMGFLTEAGGKVVGQVKDNKGNAYDVEVDNKNLVWLRSKRTDDIVPSGWRLKDVKNVDTVAIDFGQNWSVSGMSKVLKSIRESITEATDADVSKILKYAEDKLGADVKGNTMDFGVGSVVHVSIEKGKIKFDGGLSSGVEYFKNAKDAIRSLT